MHKFAQEPLFQWLSQYAYQPGMVYLAVFLTIIASGFGMPIPEEIVIVSVGLITYMGANPDLFPPPYTGAPVVHGIEAAAVTLLAVLFADALVFSLGRIFGRKLVAMPRLHNIFTPQRMDKIEGWVKKHGLYAVFVFRFTAGLRFPAHIILGMSRLPFWQFALVDGFGACLSIPTQILLIYYFGEPILHVLHKFKIGLAMVIGIIALIFLIKVLIWPRLQRSKSQKSRPQ